MKTLSKLLMVLAVVGLVGVANVWGVETSTQTVTITVTPVVTTAFTIDPATIALGNVDVGISTGNVSALEIENTGGITLTFEKTVMSMTNWTLGAPAKDVCKLQAAAQENVPSDWSTAISSVTFSTSLTVYNDLTDDTNGTQLSLDSTGTENLWFNLDMPTDVSAAVEETITVRIKGTSQ